MFEGAGQSLAGQIDRKELQTGVDGFVAGHCAILSSTIAMDRYCRKPMTGAILWEGFSTTSLGLSRNAKGEERSASGVRVAALLHV